MNSNIIIDTTRVSWMELKEMADKGHEISNHSWSHKNLVRINLDEVRTEIFKNNSAIFQNIGILPRTFCYPYNSRNEEVYKITSENRVATRTQQISIGSKSTPERFQKWLNQILESEEWGIGMTHGITYGYDAFKSPSLLWEHFDEVKALEDKIWVGTFYEIAAYRQEQENFKWKRIDKKIV